MNVPDIGYIPVSSEDYINESNNLTQETIENMVFPEVLSPLQQEFKSWHKTLSQLHPKSMFRLVKLGSLQSIFIYLKDYLPLCVSCMFVTASIRQWRKKGKKAVSIRKETDNNPVDGVSVDRLQSDQPVLVPQFSGKLTSALIWDAQVMVGRFSGLTYV